MLLKKSSRNHFSLQYSQFLIEDGFKHGIRGKKGHTVDQVSIQSSQFFIKKWFEAGYNRLGENTFGHCPIFWLSCDDVISANFDLWLRFILRRLLKTLPMCNKGTKGLQGIIWINLCWSQGKTMGMKIIAIKPECWNKAAVSFFNSLTLLVLAS